MPADSRAAVLAFRLIAAQAERLADGLERGKFWPGEVADGLVQIRVALRDAQEYADRDKGN